MDQKTKIESLLLKTPGVINYSTKNYIEVQPGVMTPLVVNIKNTTKNFKTRRYLAEQLASLVNPKSTCICGIESGGSYYASIIADITKKPLILFRKESKEYGIGKRIVGTIPSPKGKLITIIDDVIGEGKISTANVTELIRLGYKTDVCAIFSYLPEMKEFMSKIRIITLSDINKLCKVGLKSGHFKEKDVAIIKKECRYSSR